MNFANGSVSAQEMISYVFALLVVLLIAFPIHECAHALTAKMLGDDTAYLQGRITLNPLAHLDLMGTICMVICGIGWAKPVPVNATKCRKVKAKSAMAITAAAGPISNVLVGLVFMIIYKIVVYSTQMDSSVTVYVAQALFTIVSLNLYLAVFNLLPIPPFDGSRLFLVFLPTRIYFKIMQYEQYIMIGIMLLLWTGVLSVPLGFLVNLLYKGLYYMTCFIELLFGVAI